MNTSDFRSLLLWCLIFNYVVLLVWIAALLLAHEGLYRLHSRWFRISIDQFDLAMYGSMAIYKIGILLLNLAPLVALLIVGG